MANDTTKAKGGAGGRTTSKAATSTAGGAAGTPSTTAKRAAADAGGTGGAGGAPPRTPRSAKAQGGAVPAGAEGGTTPTKATRARGAGGGDAMAKRTTGTAGGATAKNSTGGSAGARRTGNLRSELRAFATARPGGWNHADWLTFLDHLGSRGHDTSNPNEIGRQLERERLNVTLSRVKGLGPKRADALVERYETLWSLRHADADELASVPGMNRSLAEKVRQGLD